MSTYTGPLPYTDENDERIINSEHYQSGTFNAKKVILYDTSGNAIAFPGVGSAITDGTTTVPAAGTAVRITVTSTPCKGVWLSGDTVAGIALYVGGATVVGNASGQRGICIIPGNNPVFLQVSDLNLLYVDAASNGGKLAYLVVA